MAENNRKAIYPGTFDPFTVGHLDIVERASRIVDELIVGVLINENKTPLFTTEERIAQILEATKHLKNVRVVAFEGLLVDLLQQEQAHLVIRGIRCGADIDYEQELAGAYKQMYADMDIVYLLSNPKYQDVSSTVVREALRNGTEKFKFIPIENIQLIEKQWGNKV